MWVKKQQLEPCMEQLISAGLKKEYDRAVCCHPVYLTYKLESRWVGETTTSDTQMTPH